MKIYAMILLLITVSNESLCMETRLVFKRPKQKLEIKSFSLEEFSKCASFVQKINDLRNSNSHTKSEHDKNNSGSFLIKSTTYEDGLSSFCSEDSTDFKMNSKEEE